MDAPAPHGKGERRLEQSAEIVVESRLVNNCYTLFSAEIRRPRRERHDLVAGGKAHAVREDIALGVAKGEIVESVLLPARPAHSGDAYLRFIPRTEMDIAVVGAGVNLTLDGSGSCTQARVSLGAVAERVLLVKPAADALIGSKIDDKALGRLAAAASAACRPIDDKRGTKEYRIKVSGVIAKRAAQIALERARKS